MVEIIKAKASKKNSQKKAALKDVKESEHENMEMEIETPITRTTIIGFDTAEEILSEINSRIALLNKNTFMLKNIPKTLTRTCLKEMIPEMLTCRFSSSKSGINSGYAFIQMKTNEMVDKYIEMLNNNKINNKKLTAKKVNPDKKFTHLKDFDLKTLYFNGLNKKTKLRDIKEFYPNAKISFPILKDNSAAGSMTLTFATEEEAKEAFVENKCTIEGVKVQLNYSIKAGIKEVEEAPKTLEESKPEVVEVKETKVKETRSKLKRKIDEVDLDDDVKDLKKVRVDRMAIKRRPEEVTETVAKKVKKSAIPTKTVDAKAKTVDAKAKKETIKAAPAIVKSQPKMRSEAMKVDSIITEKKKETVKVPVSKVTVKKDVKKVTVKSKGSK